jgi:adenine-specific DNA-methyltransferase
MSRHIDKAELISKLQSLEGLTVDERSSLIGLLREHKKYGLVWEDKPEDVEERLRDSLPVLREVKDKAILSDDADAPNHILIEGDNLEALTALSYTHEGRIDVIYIDPPYNTGNKDFVYNDSFVDSEDSYRHSKWLSFMSKRLKIAKKLLSDKGVIFISIDDNEQANLKLLCDEVFGSNCFIGSCSWLRKKKGSNLSKEFRKVTEYLNIYKKGIANVELYGEKAYAEKLVPLLNRPNNESVVKPVG